MPIRRAIFYSQIDFIYETDSGGLSKTSFTNFQTLKCQAVQAAPLMKRKSLTPAILLGVFAARYINEGPPTLHATMRTA
jgi:hypothetical protein